MNFALLFHSVISSRIHGLKHWWASRTPVHAPSAAPVALKDKCGAQSSRLGGAQRPLRILTVHEAGQPQFSVGRMVISGRMADVCAELDRLAARESAAS